jgi:hypothetical protein
MQSTQRSIDTFERFTRTPNSQSAGGSFSFEGVAESSTTYPRAAVAPPPAAQAWNPVGRAAQPVLLRERACRSLKGTAVFAAALLGGGLTGWAAYAMTVKAGGSDQTALAVGAVLGCVTSSCLRAGIDFWREQRQLQRVAPAPAALAPDQRA